MKLTTLLLITVILHVSAGSYAQKISLSVRNAPLSKIFEQISSQTGYDFAYTTRTLEGAKPVSIDVKNEELADVLRKIFDGQPLEYSIEDKSVVVSIKQASIPDKARVLFAQVTVTGKVYDETGQPLPGVTVKQKGTGNGTVTDTKGAYSITVSDNNSVITFSFIGFETQELSAKDIPNGSVIMLKATATNLKEVVVNKGYYKERQELSTGDVGRVTSKEIGQQPVSDPIQALIGRVAGLNIQQTSGIPGAYANIHIRGINSLLSGNDPLYIIDGVPFSAISLTDASVGGGALGAPSSTFSNGAGPGGNVFPGGSGKGMSPFNALNPSDIEDIQVLKDADATAIYGSRGANGVILITTKKGRAGDTKLNITMSQGTGRVTRTMNMLNTQQYLQIRHEAFKNNGLAFPSITALPANTAYDVNGVWDTTHYTNWQKVLTGNTAHYTNVQANISGGNANTQFMIGTGYNRQTTVYPGDFGDKKGSVNMNLTHASSDQKFHLQFTASYVNDNNNIPRFDLTSFITLAPDAPSIYNPDGSLNWQIRNGAATWSNPLAQTLMTANAVSNNLMSNMNLGYELLPGLKLTSSFGYSHDEMNQTIITPAISFAPPNNTLASNRSVLFATTSVQTWIIEPQINYHKNIRQGVLQMLFGATFQQSTKNSMSESGSGFASDALINNLSAASNIFAGTDAATLYHYNKLYGRIGYTWEEKYLLNITASRDGSSRFGPGEQFGNFGAIGAGWIFSNEKFINSNISILSFGKLRASYGTTGNDQIPDYQFLSTYTSNTPAYQGITTLSPTRLQNAYFGWELVKKFDAGLELGFLKDRINLSVDYYIDRTGNQLVGYPLPTITGFNTIQFNLPAVVQNTGLEINLNTVNIKTQNFSWASTANLTIPQNKLISFPGLVTSSYANTYIVGQSIFIKKAYQYTGVNPQNGTYTFATTNPNGIPSFPQELAATLPVTQKFYGGLQNSFSYKRFQLDIFIRFVKQLGYNYLNNFDNRAGFANANVPTYVLARWQNPGNITTVPKFSTTVAGEADPNGLLLSSNAVISDASFIRLQNVSLSFNLPKVWQQQVHLQDAKVFMQGQNLLTFTNYLGIDPESQGLNLPPLRMITWGLSASF